MKQMSDVFNKILRTIPNTFVTFTGTAPVSSGFSPMPYTATGLTYSTTHLLPGGPSGCAKGSGSITFNGRLGLSPTNGGSFSVEAFITTGVNAFDASTTNQTIIDIGGSVVLKRDYRSDSNFQAHAMYHIDIDGVSINALVDNHGMEHICVSVEGRKISIIINGESFSGTLNDTTALPDPAYVSVFPDQGMLWGVVLRNTPTQIEYAHEIAELISAFPTPAEADEEFNATTFDFDKSYLQYLDLINLEDVDFLDSPVEGQLFNGSSTNSLTDDTPVTITGVLPLNSPDLVDRFMLEVEGMDVSLTGENKEVDDATTANEQFAGGGKVTDTTMFTFDDTTNGLLSGVKITPSEIESSGGSLKFKLYTFPASPQVISSSTPDRVATISADSDVTMLGDAGSPLFAGGLMGRAYVEPDASATASSEYPLAYGMWVMVNSAGNLAKTTAVNISVNASLNIVFTGASNVYVDGSAYTTGAVTKGWHYISFIPTAVTNERFEIGATGSNNVIKTFSLYYAASPSGYMQSLYKNYVDPKSVRPVTPDIMAIVESSTRVYSHEWSISSAD